MANNSQSRKWNITINNPQTLATFDKILYKNRCSQPFLQAGYLLSFVF